MRTGASLVLECEMRLSGGISLIAERNITVLVYHLLSLAPRPALLPVSAPHEHSGLAQSQRPFKLVPAPAAPSSTHPVEIHLRAVPEYFRQPSGAEERGDTEEQARSN